LIKKIRRQRVRVDWDLSPVLTAALHGQGRITREIVEKATGLCFLSLGMDLQNGSPDVEARALITDDGLMVASALPQGKT
jgi:hypothetical protein